MIIKSNVSSKDEPAGEGYFGREIGRFTMSDFEIEVEDNLADLALELLNRSPNGERLDPYLGSGPPTAKLLSIPDKDWYNGGAHIYSLSHSGEDFYSLRNALFDGLPIELYDGMVSDRKTKTAELGVRFSLRTREVPCEKDDDGAYEDTGFMSILAAVQGRTVYCREVTEAYMAVSRYYEKSSDGVLRLTAPRGYVCIEWLPGYGGRMRMMRMMRSEQEIDDKKINTNFFQTLAMASTQ
jgi:hypothetical protein